MYVRAAAGRTNTSLWKHCLAPKPTGLLDFSFSTDSRRCKKRLLQVVMSDVVVLVGAAQVETAAPVVTASSGDAYGPAFFRPPDSGLAGWVGGFALPA